MKVKVTYFFTGFLSCFFLMILGVMLIGAESNTSDAMRSRVGTSSYAYQDSEICYNFPYETLLGHWKGKKEFPDTGETQVWTNTRTADGRYRIEFSFFKGDELIRENTEEGFWAYSGCLYSVVTDKVDDSPVLYQEIYRVHELSNALMTYSNFRTGKKYTLVREY